MKRLALRGVLLLMVWSIAGAPARLSAASSPRNLILFVGDGMGVSTVTAARIYAGQLAGGAGEEHSLSFEAFPNLALVKTYTTDRQVPDSAGAMTALITGQKARFGMLSLSSELERGNCADSFDKALPTLLEQAEQAGYRTGIVTTTSITHATPGATYAHAPNRNWENDALMPKAALASGCRDIARQLIEFELGDGIDILLGGGRSHFLPAGRADPERKGASGQRADGRDLIAEWLDGGENRAYVWNSAQFQALPAPDGDAKPPQVLGLFEPLDMQFEADRAASGEREPSLAAMTEFAIRRLRNAAPGFFLLVEGGRIDHAHHFGNAYRALTDTLAFDAAVARALALTDPAETLILATADHSHSFTISGYPPRGNPILGKTTDQKTGRSYPTLGYMNGPGYRRTLPDFAELDTEAPNFQQLAGFPLLSGTHGGEDVAAYAIGLGADKLRGVMEQNRIYHLMFEALFGRPPEAQP